MSIENDQFMLAALKQAKKAALNDEVPVGAVIVLQNQIIAFGYNLTLTTNDPTAHAEIVAIRGACSKLGDYRLPECELYVTLEPCCMCAGAVLHARLKNVYFGAYDQKSGVASNDLNIFENQRLNHHTNFVGGVLADKSKKLLQSFFLSKRG